MKKAVILVILFSFLSLSAQAVYFYRNGKKIEMKEQFSVFKSRVEKAYIDPDGAKFFLSGKMFVKLPFTDIKKAEKWCEDNGMKLEKQFKYIPQWYLVSGEDEVFKRSAEFVETKKVLQAEPSFYYPFELKAAVPDDPFFANQWHLRNGEGLNSEVSGSDNAHVAQAWDIILQMIRIPGKGIKIAIIDDGFDFDHEDLSGIFLNGHDFYDGDDQPLPGATDAHGTCCAGVIAAKTNNGKGVAGVCPECRLIPIRMDFSAPTLDSIAIESFTYAAENGAHIISNSWGPLDGGGPVDMSQPLKDLVKTLTTDGRNGKGIVILFAAGNGNESIEEDGFASNPDVFGIGSTNASGIRSSYSDYGVSLDFMTPSGDRSGNSISDGIYTTDNLYKGYVPGIMAGDTSGLYVFEFTGTSASCPLAAGIVGLVLGANPALTKDQTYDVLKDTADKVGDEEYDENGFNEYYGYGRINACKAVIKAFEMAGKDVSELSCDPEPVDFEYPDVDYELEDEVTDLIPTDEDENHDDENPEEESDDNADCDTAGEDSMIVDTDHEDNVTADQDRDMEISDEDIENKDNGCSCSLIY